MKKISLILLSCLLAVGLYAQENFTSMSDGFGQDDDSYIRDGGNAFGKNRTDTASNKEIPRGIHVWTIDRRYGDITPAEVDTMQHMFHNWGFGTGRYGEFNTTGNNFTARLNRIVIDRPLTAQFIFTQPYDQVMKEPDEFHFTNTLSPLANITYDNCGDKLNGEDHIDAKFAVNAGKKLGFGFDLDYAYARGYFSNQSTSHFGATLYGSYRGDQYQAHLMFSTYHQKVAENGGITSDKYVTNPESFSDNFAENEIPTVLSQNWNRNDNLHLFLSHRYNIGFYRKEKMTAAEIEARKFAAASKSEQEEKKRQKELSEGLGGQQLTSSRPIGGKVAGSEPQGRPDGAKIMGDEPVKGEVAVADSLLPTPEEQARQDSLLAAKAIQDSIDATMKDVFVPVTSIIHTADINTYDRIYQAYETPDGYYANTYYQMNDTGMVLNKNVYDQTKLLSVKNTVAIALLEGFNKWVKSGLKVFVSHELRRIEMPDTFALLGGLASQQRTWNENAISIGGELSKSQGKTWHYKVGAETWLAGEEAGQLKVDFSTDLNFRLFGDTVTLAAKAYFYRLHPTFYQRHYHSKNLWWDNTDLSKETRTRIEGLFSYQKTRTSLRVAVEEIQNYTYFGMSYDASSLARKGLTAGVRQESGNINLLTAQLRQDFTLGPLNWESIVTYQNSSNQNVLPVPDLNVYTNLYLRFKVAKVLDVMLGADATYFTKYYAPDYCPALGQYAVQENEKSRVELGGYPFVNVYANMHLKRTRFFVMYSHVNNGSGTRMAFLAPHYPTNSSVLRMGVSWNFFN